jgi:hypothetical protein
LYHVLVDDDFRGAYARTHAVKSRQELDGRNSGLYADFYDTAADKFNDQNWVPSSLSLPDVHPDFAESKLLNLTVTPVSGEQLKKKLSDARYKMVKVIADWEQSGNGAGQCVEEDNHYVFVDGDNRKSFLRERPPHVLYLWHISHTYGILQNVRQQLSSDSSCDGNNAPSVADSGTCKRGRSPNDDISKDIRRMATSINGLVDAAKCSIEAQSLELLSSRRHKLEESIKTLDDDIMEYELKLEEEELTRGRRVIYERALDKKKKEYNSKKEELDKVSNEIKEAQGNVQRQLFLNNHNNNDDTMSAMTESGRGTPQPQQNH